MKHSLLPAMLLAYIAAPCAHLARAGEVVTSSDFADAWNGGSSSISIAGELIDGVSVLVAENSLNPFGGATLELFGANGMPGIDAASNVLYLGPNTLAFAPGWDYPLAAAIRHLGIYGATNGAVSFKGDGTGAHSLSIENVLFYANTGTTGAAVNVQTQMQSSAGNTYTLTDNYFLGNNAANGGAVVMSSNNAIFTSGANTFSVIDTLGGTGTVDLLFGLNKATAGNGGGLYFMGNNAQNVRNEFSTRGYTYYQNSATGLGGALFNGVLNGNSPSANHFRITGSNFVENQATSGGAVATSINGGNTDVAVTLDGLFGSNLASGNGGAVYNAVGDQYSPYGGAIDFAISGVFDSNRAANGGAIYNDLRPGQSTVTVNITHSPDPAIAALLPTQFLDNTVSGGGGAIHNTSGNNNPGTAVVNIADGINFYGNSADFGGALYNDGNGVINLNTVMGGQGISFTDNSASRSANGADIYQASASATININGTGLGGYDSEAVDVNGGIAGIGTINQGTGSLLTLGEKSQNFDFKGVYNQGWGSVLNAYGLMFGGTNNLAGVANIHSGLNSVYFNANLEGGARMNYTSTSTERVSLGAAAGASAPGLRFTGGGASVYFTKDAALSQSRALFTLEGKIDNGQANTIEFSRSDVAFGALDFTGGTEYRFWDNSVINLAGPLDPYQQYDFTKLTTNDTGTAFDTTNSLLSLRVGNDRGALLTDTINVLAGEKIGRLGLGRVYVNDADGVLTGRARVILGDRLVFENGQSQYVSTALGTYKVTTVDDQYVQFANTPAGNTTTTVNPDDGTTTTTTDHTGSGGGATTTTTTPDGGATTTTQDNGGNTTTTTTTPDGGATTSTQDGGGNTTIATVNPGGDSVLTHANDNGETSRSQTNPDGGTETTIIYADGGKTVATTRPDGGASLEHTDRDGNKTVVTINPDGAGTITITPAGGSPATTDVPKGGGEVVDTGDGSVTFESPASGDSTATFNQAGGGASSTVTVTPTGSSSTTTDSGGSTIETSTGADGTSTTTGTTPGGGGNSTTVTTTPGGSTTTTVTTPGDGSATGGSTTTVATTPGGSTTTVVKTPDGGTGSTTTVTTGTNGGGSTVVNPDGSTAGTTIDGDGAKGSVTTPTSTILALDDVNALTPDAQSAGMSSGTARNYQIAPGETYHNNASLDPMADGAFSVHGAAAGTATSVLSGLNATDPTTRQSLFDIGGAGGIVFNLEDLTVQDAFSATGGSVLNLNNANATATLANLTVRNNESGVHGGAVNVQVGTLTSTLVDYQGNRAAGDGGAFANGTDANTSVRGGSFSENRAARGGAIYNNSSHGSDTPDGNPGMTLASGAGMTFTGNAAAGDGGAIYNDTGGTLTLIADSSATDDPTDGSIVFSGNTAGGAPNDIHNLGTLVFTGSGGTIALGGGVSGTGTIAKEGESALILGRDADNSRFTGTFGQTKGIVDADGQFFGGDSTVRGGLLNWNADATKDDSARLQVIDGGTINVYGNLQLANPGDLIAPEAATNLYGNIDLAGGAVYLSTQDRLSGPDGVGGTVSLSDGYLTVVGADMAAGALRQTGGVARFENRANVHLDGSTPGGGLSGGDIVISNATVFTRGYTFGYGPGGGGLIPTSGTLAMGDDALLDTADGVPQTHVFAGKFGLFSGMGATATAKANFVVDLDAQALRSDLFVFEGGTTTDGGERLVSGHPNAGIGDVVAMRGTVVLSGLNLVKAPATKVVPFTIMTATGGIDPGIVFTATANPVDTAVGPYSLVSLGAGMYELRLLGFHPAVYRGQVGTLAAVSGQSHFNGLLFDHVHMDSFDRAEDGRPAPWQFIEKGKGLWAKPYFARENLPIGGDIGDVDNDVYGVALGMDFSARSLVGGWKFLPTVFAAYNGGRQEFADVETTRDGGQAGFMGTFSRERFAASVMGYAGGYRNEMKIAGEQDKPGNWFAGGALKAAYNLYAGKHFLFQPYALAAYNVFGDQAWDSGHGSLPMKAGGFHGWNLAPGLAVAYNLDGWSVQASAHYMFNFNNRVAGGVGEIGLRGVDTGDGYLEYSLGVSWKINDALSFEGKAAIRSGSGAESYGGHLGFSWRY